MHHARRKAIRTAINDVRLSVLQPRPLTADRQRAGASEASGSVSGIAVQTDTQSEFECLPDMSNTGGSLRMHAYLIRA